MAASANTILLKGDHDRYREESVAAATISPGNLLMLTSANKVQRNTLTTGNIPVYVALEWYHEGRTVADNYAADETVQYHVAQPGDVLNVLLDGGSAAVVIGDRLEWVSGGVVQKLASGVAKFQALEALDISGGSTDTLIKVRVL